MQGGASSSEGNPTTLKLERLRSSPPIADPSAIFSNLSTCADILARYTPSSVRMSWGPDPAESSGSTSAWPNQVADGYNYGPSGALELFMYVLF